MAGAFIETLGTWEKNHKNENGAQTDCDCKRAVTYSNKVERSRVSQEKILF
jgi:hypothetical protein